MSKFAMVFPGQGSQSIGMLHELSAAFPIVQTIFAEASSVLDFDLWALVQSGSADELDKTWNTQPALLAASYAIYQIWQQKNGAIPAYFAGHSLGEYSALTCANVIEFKDAIALVALRGKLMQEAVPAGTGAMYAIIGLEDKAIIEACATAQKETAEIVSAVNFNSPGQVVIAGTKSAVEKAAQLCKEAGAKRALPLAVSVPSHCALMKPAADKLAEYLINVPFSTPKIPVINNVNVQIETDSDLIKQALVKQLYYPVRWSETVEWLANHDIKTVLEVGPGKVLTGLTKRIVPTLSSLAVNDLTSLDLALSSTENV